MVQYFLVVLCKQADCWILSWSQTDALDWWYLMDWDRSPVHTYMGISQSFFYSFWNFHKQVNDLSGSLNQSFCKTPAGVKIFRNSHLFFAYLLYHIIFKTILWHWSPQSLATQSVIPFSSKFIWEQEHLHTTWPGIGICEIVPCVSCQLRVTELFFHFSRNCSMAQRKCDHFADFCHLRRRKWGVIKIWLLFSYLTSSNTHIHTRKMKPWLNLLSGLLDSVLFIFKCDTEEELEVPLLLCLFQASDWLMWP